MHTPTHYHIGSNGYPFARYVEAFNARAAIAGPPASIRECRCDEGERFIGRA